MPTDPELHLAATIEEMRRLARAARSQGCTLGLVPTMGALHEGHVRLIRACAEQVDRAAVSIFVNPTQFGPHEDYARYPRSLEADCARCAEGGACYVFAPGVEVMYPTGTDATSVVVPAALTDVLEGATRPGHFRGVATVVLKLLNIVQPDVAVFGEKDYQQLLVIRRMVADLDVPVEIRAVPIVREPDGLAMSSRNAYLNPEERRAATVLSRALARAGEAVAAGERTADRVRQVLRETVESERLARLDYAEVADPDMLAPVAVIDPARPPRALLAAWVGTTRLIDNAPLVG
jgi:pantoate--beta-alanine ligase